MMNKKTKPIPVTTETKIKGYMGQDYTFVGDGKRVDWKLDLSYLPPILGWKAFAADNGEQINITTQNIETGEFTIKPPIPYGKKVYVICEREDIV
jgi:hypothetical protein